MRLAFFAAALALSGACAAQDAATVVPANVVPQPGQVVASGAVPDQATKADVLARLQQLYGVGNVIDRIDVGGVVAPPNWSAHVGKMISPPLKQINRGQLDIDGTQISLRGEVQNEASRQQIASALATALNPTYKIVNGLRVAAGKDEQGMLDNLLANRTVEFETGSATLTPRGRELLDEVANVLPRIRADKVQIIGHTDSSGSRATNLALSQARADAVKAYMVEKGLPAARFDAVGVGPDQPLMSNATAEGRAKNRRIEFRAGS
ncbi:cell envelope biogenesis protein OmpA [Bordetella genomosp. 10]|uniref:Cell envelope biogenesis protein OmpA n=1 Tax=Bordetella genomosp. 10 TaxID=1416804 RepID=A0A261S145_9BORD|nr:OmpA family protein [Bordetella genomosp. 10]OZI30717.1 cell envelope biogenesis protein OmpA [Bordetella genomosp. 10]